MRVVNKDQFYVVGLECQGTFRDGSIPRLWGEFFGRIGEIANRVEEGVCYGVITGYNAATEELTYLAGVEVAGLETMPEGFVGFAVPAGAYACILHKGSLEYLPDTHRSAYTDILPSAGLTPSGDVAFHRYDERSDMSLPEPEVEIYIPVIPPAEGAGSD